MSERAWMAWAGWDPSEGAVVVFASSRREAKLMAYPVLLGWCDDYLFIDVRLRRLPGDCEHLRAQPGPHVNESPPLCERCELWYAEPLIDGLCESCYEENEPEPYPQEGLQP